jgi:glycosyltransferase involved in cell wall biosynthesis
MAELITHDVTGLHVPRGDPAALAETMENAADATLCRRLSENIRPPDDVAAMASAHLDQYCRLLQRVTA